MTTITRLATAVRMEKKDEHPVISSQSSSDDEDFADAMENIEAGERISIPLTYPMTLSTSLEQCEVALNRFLNNDLQGAMQIMRPWSQSSLYHSLATSIFEFIPAVLTLDPRQVETALLSIKRTLSLCQQHRRTYSLVESLGTIIKKPNFSAFTELEAHAELCYAEALLLQAALALLDGEDLTGLVRATLRVKSSHNSYKTCVRILEQRCWEDERLQKDFSSGVHLGRGAFKCFVSMLPAKIITLLAYAGFEGNRAEGLEELARGSRAGGLRAPLCDLTLLAVQLVVGHFVAAAPDMRLVTRILNHRLQQYPEGAWFLLFLGRLQLIRGLADDALATYARVAAVPRLWPQLRHLTYWECMWANSIELRWREAAECAGRLLAESTWSRAVYAYARAAFLLQLRDLTPQEELDVNQLLKSAASYRQRIAGKSLPMEKFVARRCVRWAGGARLPLPGLELLCLWNMFPALAAQRHRTQRALQIIDEAESELRNGGVGGRYRPVRDCEALLLLLRGSLLAAALRPQHALPTLNRVIEMRNDIQEDTFLVPYSMFEIACCHISLGDRVRGQTLLREIRRNCTGFLLESRLQFRLHDRLARVNEMPEDEEAAEREERTRQRAPPSPEPRAPRFPRSPPAALARRFPPAWPAALPEGVEEAEEAEEFEMAQEDV